MSTHKRERPVRAVVQRQRITIKRKRPNGRMARQYIRGLRQLVVTIWSQQFGRRAFGSQKYNMVVLRNIDRIA